MTPKQQIVLFLGLGLVGFIFYTSTQKKLVTELIGSGSMWGSAVQGVKLGAKGRGGTAYKAPAGSPLNKNFNSNPVAGSRFSNMSNPNSKS